jgi:hypothetical protein
LDGPSPMSLSSMSKSWVAATNSPSRL